jgi:hypothetical protein
MGFVIGVVAALLVVFLLAYLTVKNPKAGKIEISLVVVLIAIAVFLYFHEDNRVAKHKSLIPIEQIKLSDIQHQWAYGAYYKLTAKIVNESPRYRLQAVDLKVDLYNCPEDDKKPVLDNCELINSLNHTLRTRLDARKSKTIEAYLLLNDDLLGDVPVDKLRWKVKVVSGLAR